MCCKNHLRTAHASRWFYNFNWIRILIIIEFFSWSSSSLIINNLKNDFIYCLSLHVSRTSLQQNCCIIALWNKSFFSTSKNFSTFSSSISSKKNISTMFFSRCACVFLTSRVITEVKLTIITMIFFNLFYKMNKQILSFAFFS